MYAAGAHLDAAGSIPGVDRAISGAKFLAGEAAIANGKAATQVYGGMGFTWEIDVHLYLKRAWVLDTHFGSADEHSMHVGATARVERVTRPQTTVLDALAQRLAIGSRRSLSRLRRRELHGARDGP